jgi:photosystem II stability/assembly factor-like uncharacterized protein
MKKIALLVILGHALCLNAQSWTPLNVGTPSEVLAMSFPSIDTGYVLMGNGQIRKTTNSAANWTQCTAVPGSPTEIEFISGTRGCVIGNNWSDIFLTTDGGLSWNSVLNVSGPALYNICFVNASLGYASATSAGLDSVFIYKTIDGGTSWSSLAPIAPPVNAFYPFIYFTTPLTGFIAIDSYTYRTIDGAVTWTSEYMEPNTDVIFDIHSPDGLNIFAGYMTTAFASSNDAGDNWTAGTNTNYPGYGVYFTSATHGYYCGGNGFGSGAIEETNNGGATWTPVHIGNSFWCMEFPSMYRGYVGGTNGVIVRYDGGPQSLEENSSSEIGLYPNPAHNSVTIDNVSIGSIISVVNSMGEEIISFVATTSITTIDLTAFSAGIYFLRVASEEKAEILRLVVQ